MVFSRPSSSSPTWTACADSDEVPPPPLSSSPFRAVVPQPTDRWGTHIYDALAREEAERRHQRGRHVLTDSSEPSQPATWAREHLFEKVLTPSDVGNLNRLVVPKHHAEEHFLGKRNPVMAAGMGVLLDFSDGDEGKKTWRFRYSYCTSSRIYIFTKGWRRFVREKGLQAGDTVAFSRSGFGPFKQLNIDYYRRRPRKQEDGQAGVIAVDNSSRVVMLFGVDIAR